MWEIVAYLRGNHRASPDSWRKSGFRYRTRWPLRWQTKPIGLVWPCPFQTFQFRRGEVMRDALSKRLNENRNGDTSVRRKAVVPGAATGAETLLNLQGVVGNQAVSRMMADGGLSEGSRTAHSTGTRPLPGLLRKGEETTSNLKDTLGYRPKLALADYMGQGHPVSVAIMKGTKATLEAALLEQDQAKANQLYFETKSITANLREALRKLGDTAPHRFLWSMEEAAWGHVLGEIETGFSSARRGHWTEGRDAHWSRMLFALDKRLIKGFIAGDGGPSREVVKPGGKFKQRIPIGVFPVPGAILNVYVVMEGSKKGDTAGKPGEGGAASTGLAFEVDEGGKLKGGGSMNLEGPAGSKVSGSVGENGPSVSAETGKAEAGGSSVQGSAKVDASGAEAGLKAENPAGWTAALNATSGGGLSYQISHPKAGGVSISGEVGSMTMGVLLPEMKSGDYTFNATLEIQVIPAPHLWPKTLTQTDQMLRFAHVYYGTLLALAAVPAVVALGAEIGAVTTATQLPRVVISLRPAFAMAL